MKDNGYWLQCMWKPMQLQTHGYVFDTVVFVFSWLHTKISVSAEKKCIVWHTWVILCVQKPESRQQTATYDPIMTPLCHKFPIWVKHKIHKPRMEQRKISGKTTLLHHFDTRFYCVCDWWSSWNRCRKIVWGFFLTMLYQVLEPGISLSKGQHCPLVEW